jgi:redox-sensitive bicupin YhaK (pirin superfamily)
VSDSATVEVIDGREAQVGSLAVRRTLPTRGRRTVGPWCFVDHMGPATFPPGRGVEVPPHPHIGLQTVTWLFDGSVVHRDSLGSEQLVRPGQLNLMTAGGGIAHSEENPASGVGRIHGMQLWVALPEGTRRGPAAFEHHPDLPLVELAHGTATVLVGEFAGVLSPARRDTDHLGVELALRPGTTVLPLAIGHEHALVVADGSVRVGDAAVGSGQLAVLAPGIDEAVLVVEDSARVLLVGGTPFGEEVAMWWNFVARTRDELSDAYRAWADGAERFGPVASTLERVGVGPPPWLRSA